MDDYVTKPIQIDQLIHILTQWTNNQFNQPPAIESGILLDALDPEVLDWQQSLQLAANKEDWPMICLRCWWTVFRLNWLKCSN